MGMKFAVYKKSTEASQLSGGSVFLAKNRRCDEPDSSISGSSRFLATRRGALYPWAAHFNYLDGAGGETTISGDIGESIGDQLPAGPSREGYGFLGWFYTGADGEELECTSDTMFSQYTSEVSAHWSPAQEILLDATTNGGSCSTQFIVACEGLLVPALPNPTCPSDNPLFMGWYTAASGGIRVVTGDEYDGTYTKLYAQYTTVGTQFTVTTTSSYKNTGIYSATRHDSSKPVVIDWGDGTIEAVNDSISQKAHTYSSVGTFYVKINDNITSFAPSSSNSTWYNTTSQNKYTFKGLTKLSSKITSYPSYCFYYCQEMASILWPEGITQVPSYCFYYCNNSQLYSVSVPEGVISIGSYAFYYCQYIRSVALPSTLRAINNYAFGYCFYYSSGTSNSTVEIPSGVTTIPSNCFYYCRYLAKVVLPSTVTAINSYAFYYCYYNMNSIEIPSSVTSLGAYAFSYCYNLTSIIDHRLTAQTVQSTTFGTSTSNYTGRAKYSTGTNTLSIYTAATGYNASYWSSPLQNTSYCGFHIDYLDTAPCIVTFDAGDGTLDPSELTAEYSQGGYYGTLPEPTPPADAIAFGGWYQSQDLSGDETTTDSRVPMVSALTLHAAYARESDLVSAEYIVGESAGAWMDLGIVPTNKTRAQLKVCNEATTGNVIFGYYNSDNTDWRLFNASTRIYWDCYSQRINSDVSAWLPGEWKELEVGNNYVKDLSTDQVLLSGTAVNTFTGARTATLNNYNNSAFSSNRWGYVKLYNDDALVFDGVPVSYKSTGYMYDRVNNTLIRSASGTKFITDVELKFYYRYVKATFSAVKSGSMIQLSEMKFIDANGNAFAWPSAISCQQTNGNGTVTNVTSYSGENALQLVDGSTSTKWCASPTPFTLVFDLGTGNAINLATYNKIQFWTANDITIYSGRNPSTFSVDVSNDGTTWVNIVSETEYSGFPSSNYSLGYEKTITL